VYFQGKWLNPFSTAVPAKFKPTSTRSVMVDMMSGGQGDVSLQRSATEIEVPYTSGVVMRIHMPKRTSRSSLQSSMVSLLSPKPPAVVCPKVALRMPKWNVRTPADLVPLMKQLGVVDVFDPLLSDLTGVSPAAAVEGLFISGAVHEATITVDEQGTTAAAATIIIEEAESAAIAPKSCPKSVTVDRPFVYVLQHVSTGEVIFTGRVTDPSQQ
jgi:serpin B